MEYPDEQQNIEMNENIDIEETMIDNIRPFDVEEKINNILGNGINGEGKFDNSPLFETGDKLLKDVPIIDTEAKIRQMLDF